MKFVRKVRKEERGGTGKGKAGVNFNQRIAEVKQKSA